MKPVVVLFVGGYGRSGSTLLDRLLGQVDGVWSTGELAYVWEMGLSRNRLCGCGEPFRSCPFWGEVGDQAFGGWDRVDVGAALSLRRAVDRNRFIPFMRHPGLWPAFDRRLERYAASMRSLVLAVRDVSGAGVLVDSSKFPSSGSVLKTLPEVDLRVAHLVRDARGVAHSWSKQVTRPDVVGRRVEMRRFGPARVALRWTTHNLATEWLGRDGTPYVRLRYEDLARDPRSALREVLRLAGAEGAELGFLDEARAELMAAHTVHGNPMRMSTGGVAIGLDEAWRQGPRRWRRGLVTALAWPTLRRYGYA